MKATLCIDEAVGETRRALLDADGRPFRLDFERWSERGKRARLDEVRWGRVTARLPGHRGWFVDLGLDRPGIVEPSRSTAITEGAMLPFRVKSEAWASKGPVLSLADMSPSIPPPPAPELHAAPADDSFLKGAERLKTLTGLEARRAVEAAFDEAAATVIPLHGGGNIAIEATRALINIDVDAVDIAPQADPSSLILRLNLAAAAESVRQIALRGIGGLVVIDFVSMESRRDQREVVDSFRRSLATHLGRASEVLEISAVGLCECAIARRSRPAAEAFRIPAEEREALDALREIETAGQQARASRIRARLSKAAAGWLASGAIAWEDALAGRIGARWQIETQDRPPGRPEVWSDQ